MPRRGQSALRALAALMTVLAALAAAPGAKSQPLVDGLRACLAQRDSARRLDCYDHLARQATEPQTSARAPAAGAGGPRTGGAGAAPSPSSATGGIAHFGERNGPLAARAPAHAPRQIEALVAQIGHRSYGQLIISLDNGQVWLQTEPVDYFPLKRGDAVVIREAALGSFLLFAPFKRSTRVERIR